MEALIQALRTTQDGRMILKAIEASKIVVAEYSKTGDKLVMRRAIDVLALALEQIPVVKEGSCEQ